MAGLRGTRESSLSSASRISELFGFRTVQSCRTMASSYGVGQNPSAAPLPVLVLLGSHGFQRIRLEAASRASQSDRDQIVDHSISRLDIHIAESPKNSDEQFE